MRCLGCGREPDAVVRNGRGGAPRRIAAEKPLAPPFERFRGKARSVIVYRHREGGAAFVEFEREVDAPACVIERVCDDVHDGPPERLPIRIDAGPCKRSAAGDAEFDARRSRKRRRLRFELIGERVERNGRFGADRSLAARRLDEQAHVFVEPLRCRSDVAGRSGNVLEFSRRRSAFGTG